MAQQNFTVDYGLEVTGSGGNISGATNITATGNIVAGNLIIEGTGGNIVMSGGNISNVGNIVALSTSQVGSTLGIATNYDSGNVGWSSQALAVAYNANIISTYAPGSTITFQDDTVATITLIDNYGPEYIDIYWDNPKTGVLFPITLKTSNYAAASSANAAIIVGVGGVPGVNTWTFDTAGNLTLPVNTFAVNYANGTAVSLSGNYSDSNVTSLLSSFGSNTISTTGNISGGYLFGNGSQLTGLPAEYTNSNVTSLLSSFGSNTISTTGTITAGNIVGGNANVTGQIVSTASGNSSDGGGQIYLNGATNNRIDWNTSGTGAPAFTTRSAGAKLVLYPTLSGSAADYALGIDAGTMWSGIPGNDAGQFFKWYGGTTQVASLSGTGVMSVLGNITGGNLTTGGQVGASFANLSNVIVNNYVNVPQTWFKGALSASQNLTQNADTTIIYTSNSDPLGWGATAGTNGHIVPQKAGWYEIISRVEFSAIAGNSAAQINHQILVNTNSVAISQVPNNATIGAGVAVVATAMVELNGTTDYITTSMYTTIAGQQCVGSTSTLLLIKWIST